MKRASLRRVLACCRIALGNLCLLAILLATEPMLGFESTETNTTPTETKEACPESVVGIEHRLVRVRLLWTSVDFLPVGFAHSPLKQQVLASVVGHTLSHELLAPLRC